MHQCLTVGDRYLLSGESACDEQIEASEEWFEERITAARRDDWLTEPDPDDWRNRGAAGELRQRWWRRPSRCVELAADPHRLVTWAEQCCADAAPDEFGDDAPPPGAADTLLSRAEQYTAQQIALYRLSLKSSGIHLFDPAPETSLAGLPRDVAEDLLMVLRRCDRASIAGIRPLLTILRSVCEPLGEFTLSTVSLTQYARRARRSAADAPSDGARSPTRHRGQSLRCTDINLRYQGREVCLLRYERIVHGQDVSAQSGRSIGCGLTLLSEQSDALAAEIERYTARQQTAVEQRCDDRTGLAALDPSVRRFTQRNPFRPAPEDGCSLEDCFYGDDPDTDGNAADESPRETPVAVSVRRHSHQACVPAEEDALSVHRRSSTHASHTSGRRRRHALR